MPLTPKQQRSIYHNVQIYIPPAPRQFTDLYPTYSDNLEDIYPIYPRHLTYQYPNTPRKHIDLYPTYPQKA